MKGFWSSYFAWYGGGVWPNLISSAVTGSLASAFTVWRMRLHHRRTRAENAEHRESIRTDLAEHHRQVAEHVTAQVNALHDRLDQNGGERT